MRIAVFHELPYGGARRAALEFGREMKSENIVDLFYIDERKEVGVERFFSNVKLFKFIPKTWKGKDWRSKLYKDSIELYKLSRLHKKVARIIDDGSYDFVFVHGSKYTQTPFIFRFLKTYSVYYCQEPLRMVYEDMFKIPKSLSLERKIYESLNRSNRKQIDRTNIHKVDLLLANSKYTKKNIKSAYGLGSTVCYMGVNTSRFFPEKVKKVYDILFIGSMDDIDGYSLLKNAILKMRQAPRVRWLLRENEWISDDKILRTLYSGSKILTCLAYKEPFGLLPIEAQACGTPVLAVREGGYLDTVKNGETGVHVDSNPDDLAKELDILLRDKKKLARLSKNALEDIQKNWTWEGNTKKLVTIVKSNLSML